VEFNTIRITISRIIPKLEPTYRSLYMENYNTIIHAKDRTNMQQNYRENEDLHEWLRKCVRAERIAILIIKISTSSYYLFYFKKGENSLSHLFTSPD